MTHALRRSLDAVLGAALASAALLPLTTGPGDLGDVRPASSCTTHSSGLAKDVQVEVTKVKALETRRLEVRQDTVKVRVRIAVTAVGTATGFGYADACPDGVSNPQETTTAVTWRGTKKDSSEYTASGRTTQQATRSAVREATKLARAGAERTIAEATVRKTEKVAARTAWAASEGAEPAGA